jgi:hypothetical protein
MYGSGPQMLERWVEQGVDAINLRATALWSRPNRGL